jgi:hypothetical protein
MDSPDELENFIEQFGPMTRAEKKEVLLLYIMAHVRNWDTHRVLRMRNNFAARVPQTAELVTLVEVLDGHLAIRSIAAGL